MKIFSLHQNQKRMKVKFSIIILFLFTIVSCEYSKSVNKDLVTGLFTKGNGLSVENVYLSNGEQKINDTSFTYGEKIHLNFSNIKGFKKEGDSVFPGMKLLILGKEGDTLMFNPDLYANNNGFDISPLVLQSIITVASPMHSNNHYNISVSIWDKKGTGTFNAEMDFDIITNKRIKIENNNISYDEIYLFSQEVNAIITDNEVEFNEHIHMIFEGLQGFKTEDGKAYLGLSMICKDFEGNTIFNEEDLVGDSSLDVSELKDQIAPNIIFSDLNIKTPITCEITIWDKKSENKIKASTELNITPQ